MQKENLNINIESPTILNYPGSKKRLLDFITNTVQKYGKKGATILDIFAGTHAVGYALKNDYKILANDAEIYSFIIGKCLLENYSEFNFARIENQFRLLYENNLTLLQKNFPEYEEENNILNRGDKDALVNFNHKIKTIWQDGYKNRFSDNTIFHLFSTYYSNTYFGLNQSMQIDSIRYSIDQFNNSNIFYILLTCLYFAMKECVFSKDGHMAQPLSVEKKADVLLKKRNKSIFDIFITKLHSFETGEVIWSSFGKNHVYNMPVSELLKKEIIDNCDIIYADPPYTDMQYSRYYHILETITRYDYPAITHQHGRCSTGLYREHRFQSPLSQHGKARYCIEELIKFSKEKKKTIIFSYAYPRDIEKQKSNRYTVSIEELKSIFHKYYGIDATYVEKEPFSHCNNSNSEMKKVFEYLIIGVPDGRNL